MFSSILAAVTTIIPRILPDKEKQAEAIIELQKLQNSGELAKIAEASKVVVAEINSDSWMAKNWRPLLMVSFTTIIVNNYMLAPYLNHFGFGIVIMKIPPKMWSLLEIGIGGYIVSRGAEKTVKTLSDRGIKWKS